MVIKAPRFLVFFLSKIHSLLMDASSNTPVSPSASGYHSCSSDRAACNCGVYGCDKACTVFPLFSDDEVIPAPKKWIVARLSVETIDELLCTSNNLKDDGIWMHCSHVCWRGLAVNCHGIVTESSGIVAVLDDPSVYSPIVESICKRWHIGMVWSFRSYSEDLELLEYLSNPEYADNFWSTLVKMCTNRGIKIFEIDLNTLAVVLCSCRNPQKAICDLFNIGCCMWVVVDNMGTSLADSKIECIMNMISPIIAALTLNSHGFMKVKYLKTSRGSYRTMEVYPESSLGDFERLTNRMKDFLPIHVQLLMGISTGGIEYATKPEDKVSVEKYRHVPLSSILHRKRFGKCRFVETYDHANISSMVELPDDNIWISYDNENVRLRKLQYVKSANFGGVVIGYLEDDVSPQSETSLLKECARIL